VWSGVEPKSDFLVSAQPIRPFYIPGFNPVLDETGLF